MIDQVLLERYVAEFGHTFTVAHWERRPGDRVNEMMRVALRENGPPVSDEKIASDLAARERKVALA